jgi:RNA polymerase sigma-70 factor (ECF subfamily)
MLSLDEPGAVSYMRAFLFKTAANIAIDRKRRDQAHARAARSPPFPEVIDIRTPERRVAGEQALQRLQRVIAAMPAKCRQAFVLNEFYGMDFAAIAAEMRISERMVRKYVVRALMQCRAALDRGGTE